MTDVLHGVPVLPGTMSLMGRIPGDLAHPEGMQVLGVPACALYYKTTFLDLVLPRLLAGRELTAPNSPASVLPRLQDLHIPQVFFWQIA